MKKNEDIIINITSASSGFGIGKFNGMTVFVDNAAVGDELEVHVIKVKKNYCVAKIKNIIKPSSARTDIDCPVYLSCGGCSFRHIKYNEELKIKAESVESAVNRIGKINLKPNPIIPSPLEMHYRNKAQYPVANSQNGLVYGFYAKHSHRVIPNSDCMLQPEVFKSAMHAVKQWADENSITAYDTQTKTGILRHVLLRYAEKTQQLMVVPVIAQKVLPKSKELIDCLRQNLGSCLKSVSCNINTKDTNVILGKTCKLIYGSEYITDEICGIKLNISPLSFYQVNRSAAEILYTAAAKYISHDDHVILDLFCGIGSIGLSVIHSLNSSEHKLYGVEIVPEAVQNAKLNALQNNINNAEFFCADASLAARELFNNNNIRPDVVIVDPPRKGCDRQLLLTIAEDFAPKKLIYISCDPATLARDLKILSEYGYILNEYTPVDLFPSTSHVETIAVCYAAD